MFATDSKIKIGHAIEQAYDVVEWCPFTMKLVEDVNDCVEIVTNDIDTIVLTSDTRLLTASGLWKRASDIQQGEILKNLAANKTVLNVIKIKSPIDMYEVSNTDYVIVNGFYVDR